MKKFIAVLILLSSPSYADFSPIFISSSGTKSGTPKIVFNEIPVGSRYTNCITDISMSADNFSPTGFVLTILDGNTTAYQLSQTTMSIIESWYPGNPLCLSQNTSTYFTVSGGNFKLNVSGYQK